MWMILSQTLPFSGRALFLLGAGGLALLGIAPLWHYFGAEALQYKALEETRISSPAVGCAGTADDVADRGSGDSVSRSTTEAK